MTPASLAGDHFGCTIPFMNRVNVAIGIIIQETQVLLSRRREGDQFADQWEFPGGKLEKAESAEQCLHRELQEELGIAVRICGRLAPVFHDYDQFGVCLHPFVVTIETGTPKALAAKEIRWFAVTELAGVSFPAANADLARQIPSVLRTLGLETTNRETES